MANFRGISHLSSGAGFTQVKRDYLDDWIEIGLHSPAALRVWLWLVKASNRRNEVHTREGSILAGAGISRAGLFRAYRILEQRKFIERRGNTVYLNSHLVWRGALGAARSAELYCAPSSSAKRAA